jgi:uncharacterized membrane protein
MEKLNYSDIFKTAWKGLKSQFWLLAGLLIGFTIVYSLLSIVAMPAQGEPFGISSIATCVLCFFLYCLFQLGYLKNCFQTLDGEEPQFSSYGQVSRKLISYVAASFLFTAIVLVGLALLLLPGIYLALRLQFFFASMVDENTGAIGSLKRSWAITKGQSLSLLVVALMMMLVVFAGQIALFVGIFAAIPLVMLMYGVAFRRLTAPAV